MQENISYFPKGHIPWNKGKKLPDWVKAKLSEAHKKTTKTSGRFKKGHPNYNAWKPRELQPRWKGGITKNRGYVFISVPGHPYGLKIGFYVKRCRLVVEESIGRYLESSEIVHHINEQRDDDRLENLQVVSRVEHMRIHARLKLLNR